MQIFTDICGLSKPVIESYFRCDSEVNLTPEERKELLAIQALGDGQGYSGKSDLGGTCRAQSAQQRLQLDHANIKNCFAWFVFMVSRDCCVALFRGAIGLSAVDCGIS